MRIVFRTIVFVTVIAVGGCQSGTVNNEQISTIVGAAVGGVIGSRFGDGSGRVAATILGASVGGLIGNRIGAHLDAEARRRVADGSPHRRRRR